MLIFQLAVVKSFWKHIQFSLSKKALIRIRYLCLTTKWLAQIYQQNMSNNQQVNNNTKATLQKNGACENTILFKVILDHMCIAIWWLVIFSWTGSADVYDWYSHKSFCFCNIYFLVAVQLKNMQVLLMACNIYLHSVIVWEWYVQSS